MLDMADQPEFNEAIERLKVLAHPDRLHIAACLLEGSHTALELAHTLRRDVDEVAGHLQVMLDAGLIQREGFEPFSVYSFLPEVALASLSGDPQTTIDFGCCQLTLTQINEMRPKPRQD